MGAACSSPGEDLAEATKEDMDRIKAKGHLPCLALPVVDLKRDNNLKSVYVAEYENGTELTFLFADEDRPNHCEDCLYDTLRRPLFGRWSDIESIIIINDTVEFPGTYAGTQVWDTKVPKHGHDTVEMSKFERKDEAFVLWANTWNHLMGEANNNTEKEIKYCVSGEGEYDFVVRIGSREEVDARFRGCMTSVAQVITDETAEKLGKRIH